MCCQYLRADGFTKQHTQKRTGEALTSKSRIAQHCRSFFGDDALDFAESIYGMR